MDILQSFDYMSDIDFFQANPQLEVAFSYMKDKYPETYSKIMWSIALDRHPKSIYRNLDSQERRNFIEKEYTGFKVEWDKEEDTVDLFTKLALTKKEQFLVAWEDKMEERQLFMTSMPYNETTYELLDKMLSSTDKMWKQYLSCLKDVSDEDQEKTQGNFMESPSELGLI